MASKRWFLPDPTPSAAADLSRTLGVHPLVAQLLACRGIREEAVGRRFLEPSMEHLHDPLLLPDAETAVERLARAIQEGEKILVHGDYDVDGVCAAALMTRVLRVLKANVEVFVPHRTVDGYDLQVETVRRVAASGVRVIVTVDCGILAFEAAEAARELGVDLIITDHHEPHPDGELPAALAVVNPKRRDSEYPFQELCGTGVAFKLACALVARMGITSPAFRTAFLDLVALATCADCMPLIDENRVLVKAGLETLRNTNKAGLKALMRVAGLEPRALTTRSLGFVLGPRINAIGRLDAAEHALNLLLTSDEREAQQLADRLDVANRDRQQEQERMIQEAMRQAAHYIDDRILLLASPRWHPGVIGLVASKVAEALCRPAIMVAIDEESGTARGSCRSVEGFDIFEALNSCRQVLLRCGGHQAAAGFDILPSRLEDLRRMLQEIAASGLDEELLQPSVRVDAELPVEQLSVPLVRELALLEPHGHGNHEPVFVSRDLRVLEQRRLQNRGGGERDHLKLRLEHASTPRGLDAVFWRNWGRAGDCGVDSRIDACYTLELNQYGGAQNLQLKLMDVRSATG